MLCRTFAYRAAVRYAALLREETFLKRNPLRKTQMRLFNAERVMIPEYYHIKPQEVKTTPGRTLSLQPSELFFIFFQTCLESKALPIVHHVKYTCDLPESHGFPMGKFPKVLECLLRDQVITDKQV